MANYCVLSIKKYHTFPQISALQQHNRREFDLPNVDKSLSVHNVALIDRNSSYTGAWKDIVTDAEMKNGRKIGLRKNSVLVIEIVQSLSREAVDHININSWAEKSLEWTKKKFGEDNIVASTLHLDETSPHLHTEVVPIDANGKLNAKSFTGGRTAMMALHSSYAKEMEGFGLVRGERHSKAKKKDLYAFYSALKTAKNASLPQRMEDEAGEDYLNRMEKYCREMAMGFFKLETELERANAMIGTRIAQEFSRYSHAVSLYEDLYEKFDGDERQANARLTAYRKIENRTPSDALSGLVANLLAKFEDYSTPLTNWAAKGKKALRKIESQEAKTDTETLPDHHAAIYVPLAEADEEFREDVWVYDDDDGNGDFDI